MSKQVFGSNAERYWKVGLSVVPVKPGTKIPAIDKWSSYTGALPSDVRRREWIENFGDGGIGLLLGQEVVPGHRLVALDVDDDRLVKATRNHVGACISAKRGKKGETIFLLVPKAENIRATTFKGVNGLGNIDVLAGGRFTVLPPTQHPETRKPYTWRGSDIADCDLDTLPKIGKTKLDLLKLAIGSEHAVTLTSGGATHDAALRLSAELVSAGASDDEIKALVLGLLPEGYSGNTPAELPEIISSAREKGFGDGAVRHDYDPGDVGPIPLGYLSNNTFALRDQKRQLIIAASPQQLLSLQYQLGLAGSEFWAEQFPAPKALYSYLAAGEALLNACRKKGPFDADKVRGRGVWLENREVVENLGAPVQEGVNHIYLCFSPMQTDRDARPDAARQLKLLQKLPWRNPQDAELFFGWLAVAPICGALNWRPHAFIYGPPNAGKTTLHNIAREMLTPLCVAADGQSTEAGIRQKLGPDALPVIMDEFETDQNNSRLKTVMRLARSASSADSPVLRGTPEGNAIQFSIKTMFLWSAVNVTGMTAADQSRVLVFELVAHKSDPAVGKLIESEAAHFAGQGPVWCGYMANHAPQVVAGIDVFKTALSSIDSRLRQNMATVLAGAFVALNGRVPSDKEAEAMVAEFRPTIELHSQAQERDDAVECMEHLFSHPVRDSEGLEYPLAHMIAMELDAIQRNNKDNSLRDSRRIMAGFDMRFYLSGEPKGLLIRNGSPAVDRVFSGTRWASGAWKKAMGQIPGSFSLSTPQSFPNVSGKHRSVGLPLHLIPEPETGQDEDGPL